jgi:hypothetical protein
MTGYIELGYTGLGVLAAVTVKYAVVLDLIPPTFRSNVGEILPDYASSHPRRYCSP